MGFIVIGIFICIALIIMKVILGVNVKKIKSIAENKKLDDLVKKFPDSVEICKKILKKVNNENVEIEKGEDLKETMYLVVSNKIQIGAIDDTYTRIQTIAHECLHSIQDKKMLMFNFIYSNIYILYFFIMMILLVIGNVFVTKNAFVFIGIFFIMGFVFYIVRSYLETDAMTKARYLAKEYMEEENIIEQEEINEIVKQYDELNNIGIKTTNYSMFVMSIIPVLLFTLVCYFR